MPDHATSTSPAVQAQLDRLTMLSPGADVLGLSRITTLLGRLGDPHLGLPPVFHVAGTNGKGSTCAFLRSALEAQGYRVHGYTSPHLVRFNERIRIAGRLIDDAPLAGLLGRVLDVAEGVGASFFEVTTAAAFLAFAETPADACVIEVGLGGRLDATNVVVDPAVCGIAQLGLDHQGFLGDTDIAIAREKAGIAKPGRPLVTLTYPDHVADAVANVAGRAAARLVVEGRDWTAFTGHDVRYTDASGRIDAPMPTLAGAYQGRNLALAFAMLRHQERLQIDDAAMIAAATATRWPARMQRLGDGPLTDRLPRGASMWLDGGHNPAAAEAVSHALREVAGGRPVHLIAGMLANKDAAGFLAPFAPLAASFTALPIPGHDCHAPGTLASIARDLGMATRVADDVRSAVATLPADARVVAVIGSLYLGGEVLRLNDELPT